MSERSRITATFSGRELAASGPPDSPGVYYVEMPDELREALNSGASLVFYPDGSERTSHAVPAEGQSHAKK